MYHSHLAFVVIMLTAHSVMSITYEEVEATCNKEHGFDGELRKMNFSDPAFPEEAKCALSCLYEKLNVLKDDGAIDKLKGKELAEKMVKEKYLKEKVWKAIDECDVPVKINKCETFYEFVKCVGAKAKSTV